MTMRITTQMSLPLTIEEIEGNIFELYERNGKGEFTRHVRFLVADSLSNAEDQILEILPEYWKRYRVRSVDMEYLWKTYEDLHFSYKICKSILGM